MCYGNDTCDSALACVDGWCVAADSSEAQHGEGEGEGEGEQYAVICGDDADCGDGGLCFRAIDPQDSYCYRSCTTLACTTSLGNDGSCLSYTVPGTGEQTPWMCASLAPTFERCGDEFNTVCADFDERCVRVGFDNPETSDVDESRSRYCLHFCNDNRPCPDGESCASDVAIISPTTGETFGACTPPTEIGDQCGLTAERVAICQQGQACAPSVMAGGTCVSFGP
ncbi:MAG: hypothetical protein HYS27_00805 [Deltaproteobacteria bacterium]|nr:hypothetical protein [Deltaproteobacteria bacterium]